MSARGALRAMEPRLSRYIWRHTSAQQLWILLVVLLSMVPYFLSFDLPKQIVNGPIQGDGFDTPDATQLFMTIEFDLPLVGHVMLFPGLPLERMPTLFALSGVFLGLVIINGLFKYYINTYKGRLGERLLRRIRFELVDRILRFPPETFKRLKGAEISSMVKDEVEPLGGFTGDAFVVPVQLGGQALTALVFIFVQSFWLGVITAALVSVQALIIPRLRRRLLVLGRQRQLTARELAGRVSEIVEGIGTIRAYDTSNFERADVAGRLGLIFKIRYDIYQWKFLVKFINNFLASITPFLFYSVGGYLALRGNLDIGQLVAVIGAYKDLPGPLNDLISWDQNRQDVQVKYTQVVNQFAIDGMIDPAVQAPDLSGERQPLDHPLATVSLGVDDDSGSTILDRVSVQISPGELVALTSDTPSAEIFAETVARGVWPARGRITVGEQDVLSLPDSRVGRGITYLAPEPFLFFGTLRDNLVYGLKHAPLSGPERDGDALKRHQWAVREARLAGNPELDLASDWIDYRAAGATGPADLFPALVRALDAALLSDDVIDFAKRSTIVPEDQAELAADLVGLRQAVRDELAARKLGQMIAAFEPEAYNGEATVGENLLFGNPTGPELQFESIAANAHFRASLGQDLASDLFSTGYQIAEQAIELFAGLPPDHPFFEQLTFMSSEDIPRYQKLLQGLKGRGFAEATEAERIDIIRLSFAYIETRHRFGLLTPELQSRIVAARRRFHAELPGDLRGAIEPYDPERFIASANILDNVLFGRISHRYANEVGTVHEVIRDLFRTRGLYERVFSVGLGYHVGSSGKRLTSVQRQKLGLARALLRKSEYYVFNRPLSAADQGSQDRAMRNVIDHVRRDGADPAVIWVLSNPSMGVVFDRVITFKGGTVADDRRRMHAGGGVHDTGTA
ncbi:MAG: ABC transporter transmembrane domain-containing protein [Paracoccaceae bacterium]